MILHRSPSFSTDYGEKRGIFMLQIGVWEHCEGLAEQVARMAEGIGLVRACSHPALLAGVSLDLLIVSPGATGWAGVSSLSCRTALLPGNLFALTRAMPPWPAVTYGTSPRSTITLSSLAEGRAAVAIQREFRTLDGKTVERQELVLPCPHTSPDLLLVQVGTALLLGKI